MTLTVVGPDHTSPQGNYRPRFALPRNEYRPTRAHRRAFARVTSGVATVTPQEFDAVAIQFQGFKYSIRCDRCGGSCGSFDCSGLQCHCMDILGIGIGCLTSFVMASLCYDEGLFLPLSVARSRQSHWAFIGFDFGRRPKRNNEGHVVDGRGIVDGRAETMEAMGRRWGCLIANWDGRGWDAAYDIPGINRSVRQQERDVIIQRFHYDANGKPTAMIPQTDGNDPVITIADDGSAIESRWGASIANDNGDPRNAQKLRRWIQEGGLPPGVTYTGLAERSIDNLDPHPGGVARLSNGGTHRFHFS